MNLPNQLPLLVKSSRSTCKKRRQRVMILVPRSKNEGRQEGHRKPLAVRLENKCTLCKLNAPSTARTVAIDTKTKQHPYSQKMVSTFANSTQIKTSQI